MPYSIRDVASITGGRTVEKVPSPGIDYLLIDSRRLTAPGSSLFFAIAGERHNGHAFISDLAEKGVLNFVVSEWKEEYSELEANFAVVPDTTQALQQLAAHHRSRFSCPVIGITGSNGKTIVKEWLYQLLRQDKNIVRSPRSFNSQVGVPLSVWQMSSRHELALFEAGISRPGEMEKLENIIRPDIGIFTHLGQAHDESFSSMEQKVQEKLLLFRRADLLIYSSDQELIGRNVPPGRRTFTWGYKGSPDLKIHAVEKMQDSTRLTAFYAGQQLEIRIPFSDDASVENAVQCWCLLLHLGYAPELIRERMLLLSPVAMRLELKTGVNSCTLINDSYNSDLGSLEIALDFMAQQKQHIRKTLILSDILQSGKSDEALYREVAALLRRKGIDRLIGVGPAVSAHAKMFEGEARFYDSTQAFLEALSLSAFRDETILVKGARPFGFERISRALQQKSHSTVLEINLNALVHNLNYYRSRIGREVKVMAMVKAASYGSGSFEIANVLQFQRVDYLAVAYADEGMELRKAGITLPVLVMNPGEQGFDSMIAHRLEPEIYSLRMLRLFTSRLSEKGISGFPVHLKLDTGMHRLGFEEQDMEALLEALKDTRTITVKSVFSHMAGSEDPAHDEFSRSQIQRFRRMSDRILAICPGKVLRHILNSAGVLRFPEAHFDMVRLGIGLYGIGPDEREQASLQHIASLKSTISQVKEVKAGDTIGYSRKGVAGKDMRIATVAVGYADGLSRRLGSGKGKMVVAGQCAPIVGNVCMDMCMIDITGIPAEEGDEVTVFGEGYSILEMARDMDTIAYEVLTSVSQRVKRIYYHE